MPRLVYIVVRDVCGPDCGGWTAVLRAFEDYHAAAAYAQAQCQRQDLKNAAALLN